MKINGIEDLMKLYRDGESCDKDVFSEMKTNILIMSGKHFERVSKQLERNLQTLGVQEDKRIRLVKNHVGIAMEERKTILSSMVPGVLPYPKSEGELKHQKIAEIAQLVWRDGKARNRWTDFKQRTIDNFEDIGECACKIYFHPNKGRFKGYKQLVKPLDEETKLYVSPNGELSYSEFTEEMDEFGGVTKIPHQRVASGELIPVYLDENDKETFVRTENEAPDKSHPVFSGMTVVERIPPFDLKRDKSARDMNESPYLSYQKMISKDQLKSLINSSSMSDEEKEERLEHIQSSKGTTHRIFNGTTGEFQESKDSVLIIETYIRQCPEYPEGYFFIHSENFIFFEGTLPFGEYGDVAFPIKWAGNIRYEGSARGFSPIKKVRPQQVEINRCASAIVETQLRLGHDKVILSQGGKFSKGVDQPEFKVFYAQGNYEVVQGRDGGQFVDTLNQNIDEVYRALKVPDNTNPGAQGFDPKAEMYKKQSQRAKFTREQVDLEGYFKAVCETYLFLSSKYLSEEDLSNIVGQEMMSTHGEAFLEFDDSTFAIRMEEVSEDIDSMLAKTIELETILQYSGKNLSQATLMALLTQFPILNKQQAFKNVTLDYQNAESDILALERGELRAPNKSDKHEVYIELLTNRMKQKDYALLPVEIQNLFEQKKMAHEEMKSKVDAELLRAQQGIIPTSGTLVTADMYINESGKDGARNQRTQKAKFPIDALMWLDKQLQAQGWLRDSIEALGTPGTQADYSNVLMSQVHPPQSNQQPMLPQI